MKKFDIYKTVQLVIFVILTIVGLFVILTDHRIYQMVASDGRIRLLCILLWAAIACSFLFIFIDFRFFSSLDKDYRELDYAVYSDPVSGIANRNHCDAMIEKYLDRPLPKDIGCVTINLMNMKEVNDQYGHLCGNEMIRDFSEILQTASNNLCFVGRNGGNKFLALFESCTQEKLDTFLKNVEKHTGSHNKQEGVLPIEYCCGSAFHEADIQKITELISLSDKRSYQSG